jgi:protein phosphatase 1 regulatory subunit 42
LDFATQLQYLYLQNNQIKHIPLLTLKSLRKLYLDENEISVVTGLSELNQLTELTLGRQRLPSFSTLQFDPTSIIAISHCLEVLDVSGNGIMKLMPFTVLYNLRKFFCRDNKIIDIPEIEAMVSLPNLEEASFEGNPCCKMFKYRDMVIGAASQSLSILDDLPIPRHQQVAIKGLMEHRHKLGSISKFPPAGSQDDSYNPQDPGSNEESFVLH